jgi:hypothetical protein
MAATMRRHDDRRLSLGRSRRRRAAFELGERTHSETTVTLDDDHLQRKTETTRTPMQHLHRFTVAEP